LWSSWMTAAALFRSPAGRPPHLPAARRDLLGEPEGLTLGCSWFGVPTLDLDDKPSIAHDDEAIADLPNTGALAFDHRGHHEVRKPPRGSGILHCSFSRRPPWRIAVQRRRPRDGPLEDAVLSGDEKCEVIAVGHDADAEVRGGQRFQLFAGPESR
jgi:hypothetical protein